MLNNLIFLGQIPGTNLYITFYELQIFLEFAAWFVAAHVLWRWRNGKPVWRFDNPTVHSFTQAINLSVRRIGRIGLIPRVNSGPDQLDLFSYQLPPDA